MRGWVWRLYLGAGALATGVYYLLPPGPRAVLNVVVGASAVAAIAAGIAWHRPARRLAWWLIAAAQGLFVAGDALFWLNELVMVPYFNDPSLGMVELLVSLAYPVGDVLLLALAARLATTPGRRSDAYLLLGAAGLHPSMAGLSEPSRPEVHPLYEPAKPPPRCGRNVKMLPAVPPRTVHQ